MGDKKAAAAGSRFFWHCALCAGSTFALFATAGLVAMMVAVPIGVAIGALALGVCGAYSWYLVHHFRVACPQCGDPEARLARDTLNRQLLICPVCGYRAATGKKAIADSPFGH